MYATKILNELLLLNVVLFYILSAAVTLQAYNIPNNFSALLAFEEALQLEEDVYDELLRTHDADPNDPEVS